jgi:hypothetical protein
MSLDNEPPPIRSGGVEPSGSAVIEKSRLAR